MNYGTLKLSENLISGRSAAEFQNAENKAEKDVVLLEHY